MEAAKAKLNANDGENDKKNIDEANWNRVLQSLIRIDLSMLIPKDTIKAAETQVNNVVGQQYVECERANLGASIGEKVSTCCRYDHCVFKEFTKLQDPERSDTTAENNDISTQNDEFRCMHIQSAQAHICAGLNGKVGDKKLYREQYTVKDENGDGEDEDYGVSSEEECPDKLNICTYMGMDSSICEEVDPKHCGYFVGSNTDFVNLDVSNIQECCEELVSIDDPL